MINAEALAYRRGRGLAGPVIARLGEAAETQFADPTAWPAHLDRLGLSARVAPDLALSQDPVRIAAEGALWGSIKANGLLPRTVIVSDDAGPFAVGRHALCWVHAERLMHKREPFTPCRGLRRTACAASFGRSATG